MENNRLLKLFYASALADAAYHYGKHGIMDAVTEEKKARQAAAAEMQLKQLGIDTLETLYEKFSNVFGCASWSYNEFEDGKSSEATTTGCMLCTIAKKQGAAKPCDAFCINPFTAFAEKVGYKLEVKSTLWEGAECRFLHTGK